MNLLGMAEDKAIWFLHSSGVEWRITERDGQGMTLTANLRPLRFNLAIKDGIVIRVTMG